MTSGQCPPWGLLEPKVGEGQWHKFLNNDGQEVSQRAENAPEVEEFRLKALAFAHWTFKRFNGKAVVCDLQGNKTLSFHVVYLFYVAIIKVAQK